MLQTNETKKMKTLYYKCADPIYRMCRVDYGTGAGTLIIKRLTCDPLDADDWAEMHSLLHAQAARLRRWVPDRTCGGERGSNELFVYLKRVIHE